MNTSVSSSIKQLAERRGQYGFDAPYVAITFGVISVVLLLAGVLFIWLLQWLVVGIICLVYALYMFLSVASYSYTTRRGKFQIWAEILSGLPLRSHEQLLDLGCGRGTVLLMAAKLLPTGKATGVDVWKTSDQSGNAMEVTARNARLEGLAERVELHTADMQRLPFADEAFDVIVSSLAIHNIPDATGCHQVIDEAVRVLKPGGRLLIADFRETRVYEKRLRELGMVEVTHQMFDWRFWYGNPRASTKLISARKPA